MKPKTLQFFNLVFVVFFATYMEMTLLRAPKGSPAFCGDFGALQEGFCRRFHKVTLTC